MRSAAGWVFSRVNRTAGAVVTVTALLAGAGVVVAAADHGERSTAMSTVRAAPATTPIPVPERPLFGGQTLVYTTDGFDARQVARIRAAVHAPVAAVYEHVLDLASGNRGYPDIPIATISADPSAYAAAAGRPELARALRRGAVLSTSELRLRRVAVGGTLRWADGRRLVVSAVVDDHVLGGAEMAVPATFSRLRHVRVGYLLVSGGGTVAAVTAEVRAALGAVPVRVERTTRNGYLSSADTVLTQLQVKLRFGEFALRHTGRTSIAIDPRWIDAHLVPTRIVQLGSVTCNRGMVAALRAAMQEVTRRGLGKTVHTADFELEGGCWNPNVVPGGEGTVSRHSWGIAVDVNVDANPFGARPHQDARLVAIMRRHGFVWGGTWLRPDAMHFEYVGPG